MPLIHTSTCFYIKGLITLGAKLPVMKTETNYTFQIDGIDSCFNKATAIINITSYGLVNLFSICFKFLEYVQMKCSSNTHESFITNNYMQLFSYFAKPPSFQDLPTIIEISPETRADTPFLIFNVTDIYATSINCTIKSSTPDTNMFQLQNYQNECKLNFLRFFMCPYVSKFGHCRKLCRYTHTSFVYWD